MEAIISTSNKTTLKGITEIGRGKVKGARRKVVNDKQERKAQRRAPEGTRIN